MKNAIINFFRGLYEANLIVARENNIARKYGMNR